MSEHTPGPLEVQHWKDGIFVRPVSEGSPAPRIASLVLIERMSGWVEEVWASQPYIDAERIVLTWNCHDDLLEALEEFVMARLNKDMIAPAKGLAAIAKARGTS